MRVLVLFAHPVEASFNASLHRTIVTTLRKAGHEVDDCDLYAENFDPLLTRAERLAYHDEETNRDPVASHVARLLRAEALVFCFPVWNFGYPAILKGYFDRVFLPGVSFTIRDGTVKPTLQNITKVATVTHYGASRLHTFLTGDAPRKGVKRVLRALIRPFAPMPYLALYNMNRATERDRRAFERKVKAAMERF